MQKAGYSKNKDGMYVDKDGAVLDFNIYGDATLFGDLCPVVAEQLRSVGFQCEHKSPQDVWAASVDGRAHLFLFGHGGSTMDPYDTFMLYQSANAAEMGQQSWGNITRWGPKNFEDLRAQMNTTAMDDPKMKDLFHQMMEIYYQELPDCPLVQWFHRIPVNTWYWGNWPNVDNPYMNTALWHQTMLVVVMGLKATNAA
jgi:peptide/nickel transport system substrate-binding protein